MNKNTLTPAEVAVRYRVCKATIGRWWRAGVIPAPVKLNGRTLRWYASVLDAFDESVQQEFGEGVPELLAENESETSPVTQGQGL